MVEWPRPVAKPKRGRVLTKSLGAPLKKEGHGEVLNPLPHEPEEPVF